MGMDPDVNNFNLEALESMMNIPFNATLRIEEGRDKGDGTKWEDKNVIGKFAAGTASAKPSSPLPVPDKAETSSDDDGFDWDK